MDTQQIIMLMIMASVCFLAFLIYNKRFGWLYSVVRNSIAGCIGILAANALLLPYGLAVGVNVLTVFIIGLLGLPGLLLLYITQVMVR